MKATDFTITAVANEETKTYDIRKEWKNGDVDVYRTTELSAEEFQGMEYNTENDWRNFLKTDGSYYPVK